MILKKGLLTELEKNFKKKKDSQKGSEYFGVGPVLGGYTLVNVNAPVVATTSWWLHFSAPVVA